MFVNCSLFDEPSFMYNYSIVILIMNNFNISLYSRVEVVFTCFFIIDYGILVAQAITDLVRHAIVFLTGFSNVRNYIYYTFLLCYEKSTNKMKTYMK